MIVFSGHRKEILMLTLTELTIAFSGHRKEILKLTFRTLALRQDFFTLPVQLLNSKLSCSTRADVAPHFLRD